MSRQNGSNSDIAALRREDINTLGQCGRASSPRDLLRALRSYNLRAEACLNAVAPDLRRDKMVQTQT
ncbi:hypothetical protein [Pseudoalteromonas maricaloris]|uniref:hypothetical protein n=1 Tax=Pseudoalteromonas maricaloris TaxID=184924 RepID=UPI001873B6FB|nr:hypothetical protein [Pseudoalteromonas maricaloris]